MSAINTVAGPSWPSPRRAGVAALSFMILFGAYPSAAQPLNAAIDPPEVDVHLKLCSELERQNRGAAHCWYALEHDLRFVGKAAEIRARVRVAADLREKGYYEEASRILDLGEPTLSEDPELWSSYLLARGQVRLRLWDFEGARSDLEQAAAISQQHHHWALELAIRQVLAQFEISIGRIERAKIQLEVAISLIEEHGANESSIESFLADLASIDHSVIVQEGMRAAQAAIDATFQSLAGKAGTPVDPVEVDYLVFLECTLPAKLAPPWRPHNCDRRASIDEVERRLRTQHAAVLAITQSPQSDFLKNWNSQQLCATFFESDVLFDAADVHDLMGEPGEAAKRRREARRVWESTSGKLYESFSRTAEESVAAVGKAVGAEATTRSVNIDLAAELEDSRRPRSSAASGLGPLRFCRSWDARDQGIALDPAVATVPQGQPRHLIERFDRLGDALYLPFKKLDTAILDASQGDPEAAWQHYEQALQWIDRIFETVPVSPVEYASRTAEIFEEAVFYLAEHRRYAEAFDYAEMARGYDLGRRLRAGVSDVELEDGQLLELIRVTRLLAEEQDRLAGAERQLRYDKDVEPYRQNVRIAAEERTKLIDSIRRTDPSLTALFSRDAVSEQELRGGLLPANTSLILYFLGRSSSLAWVVNNSSVEMVHLRASRGEIQGLSDKFRSSLQPDVILRSPDDWRVHAKELDRILLSPLVPHLHHPNLLIIPHGPLHSIPFAALMDGHEEFAIQRFAISSLPSATALRYVAARTEVEPFRLMVLGDPDGTLPAAAREAVAICDLFGVTPRLREAASKAALLRSAGQFNVLHIAAHGRSDPREPESSRLQLAPAGPAGVLDVGQVYGLDLQGVRLVVLSGCETALGAVTVGDELLAFTRAFLLAGARSVIASLWPIHDDASAALMESFYDRLRQDPDLDIASALRSAQLEIAERSDWSNPYYWAGFVLVGDATSISLISP